MEVLKTALLGVPLLEVTGDVDHVSAPSLEQDVEQVLGADENRLLLDLSGCPYLDSGGISVLLHAARQVHGKGWIGLVAPSDNLVRIFAIVGISDDNPDFHLFGSVDEAKTALEADTSHG